MASYPPFNTNIHPSVVAIITAASPAEPNLIHLFFIFR